MTGHDLKLKEIEARVSAHLGPERYVAARWRDGGGLRLDIGSDGLGLKEKSAVEHDLRELLGDPEVLVYFTRRAAESDTPTPAVPAPLRERKAPFGLTIEKRAIPGVTEVIVVASGKGGVGKSTVSVNLAVALAAAGRRVGLLDADIYGPSAPLMLGVSGPLAVEGGARLVPKVAHGVKVVSFGFLTDTAEPIIWRGPMIAKAFKQLAYDVAWGELDYLVVDLPPGTGDIQLALIESLPIHGALIVTTPQDVALLDAQKALSMFQRLEVKVIGLVENMALHTCSRCGHAEPLFGQGGADRMARERKLPVVARLPLALAIREGGDQGVPIALKKEVEASLEFAQLAEVVQRF